MIAARWRGPGLLLLGTVANVQLIDFGCPVNIYGMELEDNDLLHADRHGAVVIPKAVASDVPVAIDLLLRREKAIIDACRSPGFNADMLQRAMANSTDIH